MSMRPFLIALAGTASLLSIDAGALSIDHLAFTHSGIRSSVSLSTPEVNGLVGCFEVTEDTVLTADVGCIGIRVGGVTIDLNGFTVHGGILGAGATILNGTVSRGSIRLEGPGELRDLKVQDSAVRFAVQMSGGTIQRCVFERNIVAVDLYWGGGVAVKESRFVDNRIGVNIASDSSSLLYRNHFQGNAIGVRVWDEDLHGSSGSLIYNNHFGANEIGLYILARGAANGTHVMSNRFINNQSSGLLLGVGCAKVWATICAGRDTRIEGNRFVRNGFQPELVVVSLSPSGSEQFEVVGNDGLTAFGISELSTLDGTTLAGNESTNNSDLGMDAFGVMDGGVNRGRANGNPTQCIGVDC